MPDFSAQLRLPEEADDLPPPKSHARRFALPTAAAIVLHAAVIGPLVWFEQPKPAETSATEVEMTMAEPAPVTPQEPTEVTETAPSAEPEQVTAETPPEAAPPPPPEAVQPLQPDSAEPPPPDDTPPPPPDAAPPPPEDAPPPEPAPEQSPLVAPLIAEPLEAEEVVPPPPEEVREIQPPPPAPLAEPLETVRAIAPPPPPRPQAQRPPTPRPPSPEPPAPAPAAPAAAPAAPPRPPASYVGQLMAALERHKDYPQSARYRRAEGVVVLRFGLRRDGSVASWRIERSSGHEDLDAAVALMIRRASPLPAPPPELPGDPVELVVPVRFTLR